MALTVYFTSGVDLVNTDELTVRGQRYQIVVNRWDLGRGFGLVLCCTAGSLMSFGPVRLNRGDRPHPQRDYTKQVNKLAGRIADEAQPGRR